MVYVSDDLYFFPGYSIRDMASYYRGIYSDLSDERFNALNNIFKIDTKRNIRSLSKGMQKQVAFWLGLSANPDVIILDEPVDGLDPFMRRNVWNLILADVAERELTILVPSHNLRELEDVCDHIGIMNKGLVVIEKRALENHSQLVAFKFLNPVFIYGVAVCAGLLGYIYISSLLGNGRQFWIAIPFGIVGTIGAKMITERTFRPKKIIKASVIYLAMLFAIYLFIGFDITGFENRVPDMDKIASASVVEYVYGEDYYPTTDVHTQVKLAPEAIHDSALYNAEDIAKLYI